MWPHMLDPTPLPPIRNVEINMPSERPPFERAHTQETVDRCHRWPVHVVHEHGETYIRCAVCGQACRALTKNGAPHQFEAHELLHGVTAHVLQCHREEVKP